MEKAINDDKVNNTNQYDIYSMLNVFLPEFADNGYIMDISNKTRTSRTLRWPDVVDFVRESVCAYNGKVYGIPFDGDTFQLFFRRDVFSNPRSFLPAHVQIPAELLTADSQLKVPATWDDYAKIAKLFRHVDLNGDGVADFGSCVPIKGFWNFYWIVAPMVSLFQHKSNSQGAFFKLPNTSLAEDRIEPLVDNEAFAFVMKFLYELHYESGLGDDNSTLEWSWGNMHTAFQEGRCLMYYSWPSVASNGVKTNSSGHYVYQRSRMGVAPLPGWDMFFDRAKGKLQKCTKEDCPTRGANGYPAGINAAAFMANGGMTAAVNEARPDLNKEAALDLLGYLSTNLDVAVPGPYNAFRREQLSTELFVSRSWEPTDASMFVTASKQTFRHPLQVLDLRVPNAHKFFDMYRKAYEDIITNSVSIANAQLELKTSIMTLIEEMDSTHSELYFENIYRQNLGLPARILESIVEDTFEETDTTPILIATGACILIGIPAILFVVRRKLQHHFEDLLNAVLGEVATGAFNIITSLADTATDVIACIDVYEKGKEWRKYLVAYTCLVVFGTWIAVGAMSVDITSIKEVLCKRKTRHTRRNSKADEIFLLWHIAGSQRRRSMKRIAATIAGMLQGVPMVCFIMLMTSQEGEIGWKLQVCLFTSCLSVGIKVAAGKEAFCSFKVGSKLAYVATQAESDVFADSTLLNSKSMSMSMDMWKDTSEVDQEADALSQGVVQESIGSAGVEVALSPGERLEAQKVGYTTV